MLVFDVETLPAHTEHAIMACAASKNAWYSWISPWLLGESPDSDQLIPLGSPTAPRVVVGHNVAFDRKRIAEEYTLGGTRTRFLDTMALHIAVKGISSHQRPAWNKYRKSKEQEQEQRSEAVEAVYDLLQDAAERLEQETERDIVHARRRREANDRYFGRVDQGVRDVVARLEEVAAAMRAVEHETRDVWGDDASVPASAKA